ncbi:MAG: DNA gyrase subunit A [Candidatus Ancillula sp.]|jgi:DNA gyrase subunit A|nr:DNA gyrase subunit A [Candidatus Ancillula sp.]
MVDNNDNEKTDEPEELGADLGFSTATEDQVVLHGKITQVNLQQEMQTAYLDYAMSVIIGRALPDVRDGLKPVHRRVIYAMYDGGYRPEKGYNKCSRVVGDVMGKYHPHGDSAIYDTLVRLVQAWSLRYPLVEGQGNFGSPGDDGAAAPRYTECKMNNLSMEMVRDIDKDTVDFEPNYDGKNMEPSVLPARFPNLLANGSEGIAVGMATKIPTHNLHELGEACEWVLDHPDATREEILENAMRFIKGPDFPTGATILGHKGIADAYRTGRGLIIMRANVEIEEIKGRQVLVAKSLPYQVNPDNVLRKLQELVKEGRVDGVQDARDESSGRTGMRIVVLLKKDAVAKVVLNNLFKHTQLQETFGANMLALVDGVPKTLSLDQFLLHWVNHQVDVICRRTEYLLKEAKERQHILEGYLKALDAIDEVIALIRGSKDVEEARLKLIDFLSIDDLQARAILAMQLSRLAALERQKIQDEYDELTRKVIDFEDILATPMRQGSIIKDELRQIVEKFGNPRRTEILPFGAEVDIEDLIPEEEVVVTLTRGGFIKRTRSDQYRATKRGSKGMKGAKLRDEDVVQNFFVSTTHSWLLFFTNTGRVFRLKGYELPEGGRDSKGQHINNLLELPPTEEVTKVLDLRTFDDAKYLVFATKRGVIKKTLLSEFRNIRTNGLKAINLREDDRGNKDELVSVNLANDDDSIIMISKGARAVRTTLHEDKIRTLSRIAAGIRGIKFKEDDELLSALVVPKTDGNSAVCPLEGDTTESGDTTQEVELLDLITVTESGYAKRTPIDEYAIKGRGGFGMKAAGVTEKKGKLVGAVLTSQTDELLVMMESGKVSRSRVADIRQTSRATQGVIFAKPDADDAIILVSKNMERDLPETAGAADVQ